MSLTVRLIGDSGNYDSEGHWNATLLYEVQTTTPTTTCSLAVANAVASVATLTYSVGGTTNTDCFIQGIGPAARREGNDDRQIWQCPAIYSTRPLGSTNGTGGSSPLSPYTTPIVEPWKFSGTLLRLSKFTTQDKNGDPIELQGTRELKGFEVPAANPNLHMEGYTANINLQLWAELFREIHCNSETIWGLTPRQLALMNWTWDVRRYGNGLQCVYHVLDWEIKFEGWTERFLNVSRMKVNPAFDIVTNPKEKFLTPILVANGMPVSEPWPIDVFGDTCDLSEAPPNEVEIMPEFDFLTLGFPTTLPGPFV